MGLGVGSEAIPNRVIVIGWLVAGLLSAFTFSRPVFTEARDAEGRPIHVGRLRLRTYPSGARVWIDGQLRVESTPATLLLEDGEYRFQMQLEGAEAAERTVRIRAGDLRELDIDLPRPPDATLSVFSDLEGAQVRINGFVRGTTPVVAAVTRPGSVDMTVAAPFGGRAKSVRTTLRIGEQKRLFVFFEAVQSEPEPSEASGASRVPACLPPERGYLTLGVAPEGEVFDEDGRSLGRTPLVAKALDPGEHQLSLRSLDGRYEKRVDIEVEAERTAVFRFRFTDADQLPGWHPDAGSR
jgi:hypothetical protein